MLIFIQHPSVVLVSGGLDSAVTLAMAQRECLENPPLFPSTYNHVLAVSFDYGQRHVAELDAAKRVVANLNRGGPRPKPGRQGWIDHQILWLPRLAVAGSALTPVQQRSDLVPGPFGPDVPKGRSEAEIGEGVPETYVPARNLMMLSLAAGLAESQLASDVWIGVNAVDYSGYPDCRPAFIEAFQRCLDVGTKSGDAGDAVRVRTPLIDMTKAQIIRKGLELGVDFSITLSCYDPDESGFPCGACDACLLRRRGFADAGIPEPTRPRPKPRPIRTDRLVE